MHLRINFCISLVLRNLSSASTAVDEGIPPLASVQSFCRRTWPYEDVRQKRTHFRLESLRFFWKVATTRDTQLYHEIEGKLHNSPSQPRARQNRNQTRWSHLMVASASAPPICRSGNYWDRKVFTDMLSWTVFWLIEFICIWICLPFSAPAVNFLHIIL